VVSPLAVRLLKKWLRFDAWRGNSRLQRYHPERGIRGACIPVSLCPRRARLFQPIPAVEGRLRATDQWEDYRRQVTECERDRYLKVL